MTEPMSTDRVRELLAQAQHKGLDLTETADLIAEASEDGGPGPKPDDYLSIHVVNGVVNVAVNSHYVNHGDTWQSCNTEYRWSEKLPARGNSQFVCVDLPELGLKRVEDD